MSSSTSHPDFSSPRSSTSLWLGIVGPPLLYLFDLQASYTLANRACNSGSPVAYAMTTLVAALLVVTIGGLSWSRLQTLSSANLEGAKEPDSHRFLAVGGVGFSLVWMNMLTIMITGSSRATTRALRV